MPQTLVPKATSFRLLSVSIVDTQLLSDFGAKLGSFTDVSFDKLGVTELWGFLADTRTTISLLVVTSPSKDVHSSNLFLSLTPVSTTAATSSSTLKMNRIRYIVSSKGTMTYTGPLDFVDSQPRFDLYFEPNPTMLRLSFGKNNQCATEDTEYLAYKLLSFCNSCQLHLFCDLVQFQYVGTTSYDSQRMPANISIAFNSLTIVSTHRGRTVSLIPDNFYRRFIECLPLLSPITITWSFSLVTLFLNVLTSELQDAV